MKWPSFFSRFFHSPVPRLATLLLVTLALSNPALPQTTNGSGSVIAKATTSPPPGKAMVYVYRKGTSMLGLAGSPFIFVNDYLLPPMDNSEYVAIEVPEGEVSLTATTAFVRGQQHFATPSPTGYWTSLPGCAGLDWRRLAAVPLKDREVCRANLVQLFAECGVKVSQTGIIRTTTIPGCNYKLLDQPNAPVHSTSGIAFAFSILYALDSSQPRTFQIKAEAGRTYYAKWHVRIGDLKLMDEATGAKEMEGFHPSKYTTGWGWPIRVQ